MVRGEVRVERALLSKAATYQNTTLDLEGYEVEGEGEGCEEIELRSGAP